MCIYDTFLKEGSIAFMIQQKRISREDSCIVYPTALANANSQDFGWAVNSMA
jgi:hypothetical protein